MTVSTTAMDERARITAALGDLRECIRQAEASGDLRIIEGADPYREIGALHELSLRREDPPILVFDKILGYPAGFRVATNFRFTRVLYPERGLEAVKAYRRNRQKGAEPIPPRIVETGPVFENILVGDEVDTRRFPTPTWHEGDGGPYIGTECMVINRDPDTGWVNAGTYRVQIQDRNTVTVFIEPGKHGSLIREKYWRRGEACPMVLCFGQAPILGGLAGMNSEYGVSEFAVAGAQLGRPIDMVKGKQTGLPFPADAEIVFEGVMPPPTVRALPEGPFGEWPGYYASTSRPEPVVEVQAIYHRNDPILVGDPPVKPTYPGRDRGHVRAAAAIWDALEAAGVPGVTGVWKLRGGGTRFITVISIKQLHAGHAKMAGLVATGSRAGAYLGRITIVVDDDIDITDPAEVFWALATRWDPKTQTDIIDGCWTGHIDPNLSPEKRASGDLTSSRAIFYAVRPFHWKDEFPKVNQIDREYAEAVRQKWLDRLDFLR